MKTHFLLIISFLILVSGQIQSQHKLQFHPIEHASFVISYGETTIFVDPVGKLEQYAAFGRPDLILITHAHGDHYQPKLLDSLNAKETILVGPKVIIDGLGYGSLLQNGEKTDMLNIGIEAIPMYNTTAERLRFHVKGVGNGYVLTLGDERVYIAGDTEDIPEMRSLKDIDHAFVCMNLPYTMSYEQAASAVLDFKPRHVYPYHYRGQGSDFEKLYKEFPQLLAGNPDIKVHFLKWYASEK